MKNKPVLNRHISLDGKIVGAIFQDEKGFFYRPKYNSITKGPRNPKKDGEYFVRLIDCIKSVYGEE